MTSDDLLLVALFLEPLHEFRVDCELLQDTVMVAVAAAGTRMSTLSVHSWLGSGGVSGEGGW